MISQRERTWALALVGLSPAAGIAMLVTADVVGGVIWVYPLLAAICAVALATIRRFFIGQGILLGLCTAAVAVFVVLPVALVVVLFGGYAVETLLQ